MKALGAAVRRAVDEERERCARICETFAQMMENGGGDWPPGGRLWQCARKIRDGEAVPFWYRPEHKAPAEDGVAMSIVDRNIAFLRSEEALLESLLRGVSSPIERVGLERRLQRTREQIERIEYDD